MSDIFSPSFFRRLQQLKIRTRRTFLGSRQGIHLSQRRGHGLEFSDFRAYAAGDDFRHIDWGVYGRTDRLYVRQFREEQDLNVIVILDTSESMAHPRGERKFDLARELALALGYVALTDGDTVTFSLLGQKNTQKFVGARFLHRASAELSAVSPHGTFSIVNEVRAAVARQKIPGRCFLISDFLMDIEEQFAAIDVLQARNFETSVIQILAPGELRLTASAGEVLVDSESEAILELAVDSASSREYAMCLAEHVQALEQYCYRAGVPHLLVPSDETVADVVLTRLPQMGILK